MPRPPRHIVPDVPLHITQRGVDRGATFLDDDDFAFYRLCLHQASTRTRCAVHAYVLMTNHVHLLVTPSDAKGPTRMMQSLGRRYVRYFNDRYRRTGALWEGRYRAARVDTAPYFFACSRYIELNPLRAGLAADPGKYPWSSFRHNAGAEDDPILMPHPLYAALGAARAARCAAYRALFATELSSNLLATIRVATGGRPALPATPYREAAAALTEPTVTSDPNEKALTGTVSRVGRLDDLHPRGALASAVERIRLS